MPRFTVIVVSAFLSIALGSPASGASIPFLPYDYDDDFTKAVAAHYPPLVRLLITKGARQNTQDFNGDTPLMLAIRTGDHEMVELLLHYEPYLLLTNVDNHSAATEAVLVDDPDSLPSILVRNDRLQVAQSISLAMKYRKRRVLNKFAEMMGANAADEIGHLFLTSPLQYFEIGSWVAYVYLPLEPKPDICGKVSSRVLMQGKICKVAGERVEVEWQSMSNLSNDDMQCSFQHHINFARKSNESWNQKYLGACGVAPVYFPSMPSSFDYRQFILKELH